MNKESMDEDLLFETVNDSAGCNPFSTEEMNEFVSRLIAEDKVMLSEGIFYAI